MAEIRALIFDFDGTMIDSLHLWRELDRDYLLKHAIDVPDDLQKQIEGMGFIDCARHFKKRFSLKDSIETIMDEWRMMIEQKYMETPLKQDVLDFIHTTDLPIAIATSSDRVLVRRVLNKHGLGERIRVIATSDEVGFSKPHPAVFLQAAQELQVEPQHCMVFEDTYAGVMGTRNAGMIAVAVYDRNNHDWEQTRQSAHAAIRSFDEIRGSLETIYRP